MLAHSPHTYFSSFIVGLVLGSVFYRAGLHMHLTKILSDSLIYLRGYVYLR